MDLRFLPLDVELLPKLLFVSHLRRLPHWLNLVSKRWPFIAVEISAYNVISTQESIIIGWIWSLKDGR
jgi:hypothetical protein